LKKPAEHGSHAAPVKPGGHPQVPTVHTSTRPPKAPSCTVDESLTHDATANEASTHKRRIGTLGVFFYNLQAVDAQSASVGAASSGVPILKERP